MKCKFESTDGRCWLKSSYAYQHRCYGEDCCKCMEPMTNADRIRATAHTVAEMERKVMAR